MADSLFMTDNKRDENISQLLAERIAAGDFTSAVYIVAEKGRVELWYGLGDAVSGPECYPSTLNTV